MKRLNETKLTEMLHFIRQFIQEHNGIAPSFSKILEAMDMNESVGYRYLKTLKERGDILYSGKGTLRLPDWRPSESASCRVPVLGSIPCGFPDEHTEEIEEYLPLPATWAQAPCFLLRAEGDSMIGANIENGDLVLIVKQDTAKEGDIVVALVNQTESTLKRLRYREGKPWLHPENPRYPDIECHSLAIQGVAKKVIKNLH